MSKNELDQQLVNNLLVQKGVVLKLQKKKHDN